MISAGIFLNGKVLNPVSYIVCPAGIHLVVVVVVVVVVVELVWVKAEHHHYIFK